MLFKKKSNNVKKQKEKKAQKKEHEIKDLDGNVIKKPKKEKKPNRMVTFIRRHKKAVKIVLLSFVLILLILGIYILVRNYYINKKYKVYEEKMEAYGYARMYDNETAKSSEKVTKKEMIKVIVSAIYNTTEVESIGFGPQGKYEDDEWVRTAYAFSIIEKDAVTEKNYDKTATYWEALSTLLNARKEELDIPISSRKEASFKNLYSYSENQRKYINDAAYNELIENNEKKIKLDKKIVKGQLNELVVKLVEKYNTVAPEGETLVLKEESKPKNSNIYPYILYSVDKEAYEYEPIIADEADYKTPVETYTYKKDSYQQMEYRTEQYYNAILNVDYNNITVEKFKGEADRFLRYNYPEEYYTNYVDYVKNNKIIIEGKAEVQLPIFYLDGIRYRARVKLTFNIKNSDTDKNILFGDLTRAKEVTYKNKNYTVYIDAPMGTTLLSDALRIDMKPIIDILVSDDKAVETNAF